MSPLTVTLFGTVQATFDSRPLTFPTDKCLALFAYLAVEADQPQRRDTLAALFWPEQPDQAARTNLRQTLYRLRTAIGDTDNPNPYLLVSRRTIQFNPYRQLWLDAAEFKGYLDAFKAHCANGLPLCATCHEALKTAAALYDGGFMAGFTLAHSPPFELWLVTQQERYRRQALEILGRLGAFYEETADFAQAVECARRLVAMEPWRESSHRLLMRNLAQAGKKHAALVQYENCRQILAKELGVEPSKKTHQLYEQIRGQDFDGARGMEKQEIVSRQPVPRASIEGSSSSSSRFVGREKELAILDGHAAKVLAGKGQVVLIKGEAGSGKTSLAAAFCRRTMATQDNLVLIYGRCDGHYGLGDPYQPFREALRMLSGQAGSYLDWLDVEKMPAQRQQAARPTIKQILAEAGPDLPGTLLPDSGDMGQGATSSGRTSLAQTALFEQVTDVLQTVAQEWPLILVLDDLHWIDAGSASLLFHLGRHLANSRLLIIGAYRPEDVYWSTRKVGEISRHPLLPIVNGLQRIYGDIQIDLDQDDGRAFVEAYVDSEPNRLDEEFRDRLYQKTGGNPLFTVEMLRGLKIRQELARHDDGFWVVNKELNWELLPARVEAVISERMQRLKSDCQSILAVASAQGQTFLAEVAAGVAGHEAGPVVRCLSETLNHEHHLVEADCREKHNGLTVSRYRFRHYLFQQFAYHQLDDVARSHIHEATGLALEALYADQSTEHAAELARHFEAAGNVDKAVEYLLAAGEFVYRLSANESAMSYFDRALNLLEESLTGPERDRAEMILYLARTAPILAMRGYTALEIREAANRVIALAEQLQEPDYLFAARLLLLTRYSMLAEYQPALKLGEQLFSQAEWEQNPLHLTQAHHMLGYLQFCAGSFNAALHHFNSALTSVDQQAKSLLLTGFIGRDMYLTSLFRKAWTLWFLGYPDQSVAAREEIMIKVEQLGRDHDLAFTLAIGICPLIYLQGEYDEAEVQVKRLLRLATRKGLQYFIPFGQIFLGAALVKRGRTAEGQSKIRSGIRQYKEGGQKTFLSYSLSILIDSLNEDEEAGKVLDEALQLVEETGERFFEAELWRQRGDCLEQCGAEPDEVEECFHQALDIARRQEAKSLELRAATSMARLWQRQGREQEAHTLLASLLGWFTEGFGTADLQEAQTLLAELSSGNSTYLVGGQEANPKEPTSLQHSFPGQD